MLLDKIRSDRFTARMLAQHDRQTDPRTVETPAMIQAALLTTLLSEAERIGTVLCSKHTYGDADAAITGGLHHRKCDAPDAAPGKERPRWGSEFLER